MSLLRTLLYPAVLLLASSGPLAGQERQVVRGVVRDAATRLPLADAVVHPVGRPDASVRTGTGGGFALRLEAGPSRLAAARLGYAPDTLSIPGDGARLDVALRAAPFALDPLTVAAEPSFTAASSRTVRGLDVQLRPRHSSQELLTLAPGLVIAQHGGGGKAEQIFLRGFDADHGTDVAVSVDGTPVNLVSHAHGQGYADLHFLIPELVERVEVRKGPYDARDGDLATAGSVSLVTKDRVYREVRVSGGSFGTVRGLALLPFGGSAESSGGYAALAAHYSDGPFEAPQGYDRFQAVARWSAPVGASAELVASASAFQGDWSQSGQVPLRAVEAGQISRFGSIDPSEGGRTSRYEANLGLRSRGGADWAVRAFAARSRLQLYSNFTYFLRDTVAGDGIEQLDDRWYAGIAARWSVPAAPFARSGRLEIGSELRGDLAEVGLWDQTERARRAPRVDNRISQQHAALWLQQELSLGRATRLQLGIRGDLFRFDVADRLSGGAPGSVHASGTEWAGALSPKASLAVNLTGRTTLFLNGGTGFHSNDARDVVLAGDTATSLPRAAGSEVGLRHTWPRGSIAGAAWLLDLASELVYVGDEGVTEPSGRTRRVGLDLEGRGSLARWLWIDVDLNFSRGRFRDEPAGADRIPLAPTFSSTGGLTVRDLGPWRAGMRYRATADRPAHETGTIEADGAVLVDLFGAMQLGRFEVEVGVDNLFGVEWNEAQFATTSRLRGEPLHGVSELHFTPGAGRSLQAGLTTTF